MRTARERERRPRLRREKRRRARRRTAPVEAAPNRSLRLPRLTAPVLSTRGDRGQVARSPLPPLDFASASARTSTETDGDSAKLPFPGGELLFPALQAVLQLSIVRIKIE